MPTDPAFLEKREELKRQLAAGEHKTLVDVFLTHTDRLIRKLTRRSKPLPIWYITLILILVNSLIGIVVIHIAGDLTTIYAWYSQLGLEMVVGLLWRIWDITVAIIGLVVINRFVNRVFIFWCDEMIDATESLASLEDFEVWLVKVCNRRLHLLLAITGGLWFGLASLAQRSAVLGAFGGYSLTCMHIITGMFNFSSVYLFLMVVLLSARLRRYDLRLFTADPSSSELVSRLSSLLGVIVYLFAALVAILTLEFAVDGFSATEVRSLFIGWLPIIALFILNQTSISSIIRRVKWKTLKEIQAMVEKLQAAEHFEDKETMDTINRLMDYHDRVKRTRDSAIDLSTTLNFINSLLLPLLAFVLGNLDVILAPFRQRP